jgi:AraC-like DNA-binding protein
MHHEIWDDRVAKAFAMISESSSRPLTCATLALGVNLSPSRLRRLFRIYANTTPNVALKDRRMEIARQLLCTTDLLVKEIAANAGFQGVSHFVRDFERVCGLSPSAFRASCSGLRNTTSHLKF